MSTNCIAAIDPGSSTITIAVGARCEEPAEGQTAAERTAGTAGAANGERNAGRKLTLKGVVSMPMQGISRGEIDNRQLTSESVKAAVDAVAQQLEIHISDVYLGTSGKNIRCAGHEYYVFVGDQADGEIRAEDVAALNSGMHNVQAENGQRILDRIPQRYIIDGREAVTNPVGKFGKKVDASYNFVLGSVQLLERLENTMSALGVRTRRTIPGAVASAEAVLTPEEKEMGVAVVDMGAGTTDLCVWEGGVMRYVRGIPFGAGDIEGDIKQQGIPSMHVEGLKKRYGMAMASLVEVDQLIGIAGRSARKQEISKRNLALIIEHRLREIIDFVMAEIADAGFRSGLRSGIVLTGGGAQLAGIEELFRDATGMEVRIGLPDVWVDQQSLSLAQDPAHATAIGLLLKALEEPSPAVARAETPTGRVQAQSQTRPQPQPSRTVAQPDDDDDEQDGQPKPEKRGKGKKEGGGNVISRWLDGFLREPLSDDEDI